MGQTGAALGTAAGQNLTAIGGPHSLAEPVVLGALTLLGLIGTEHAIHLFLFRRVGMLRRPVGPRYSTADGKRTPILRS